MKFIKWFLLSVVVFTIIGCGGGGGSDNNTESSNTNTRITETGVYLDSAVEGVRYKTSSGLEGYTNAKGEYKYKEGDTVEFFIGDVSLGKTTATAMLTMDNFPFTTQVAQFLQTLDEDSMPDNGIKIVAEFHELPLLKKATAKAEDASDFAKSLNIEDFDASAKNTSFIHDLSDEAKLTSREIISTFNALGHAHKTIKLQRIKDNNLEFYSYIDGTFSSNDILPTDSNIHTMLASRLSYYFYTKTYEPELDLKIDLSYDAMNKSVSTQDKIDNFAKKYLNIAALTTEVSILVTDYAIPAEAMKKDTQRRVVNAIKSNGKSEVFGFALAGHETTEEIVGILENCIHEIPWIPSIDEAAGDAIEKALGAAKGTAGKVFDCALGTTVNATGRFVNSYQGFISIQEYQYYKIAKIYLDAYFSCGYFNNSCMASTFSGNETLDDQLQYIMEQNKLDIGIDWSVRQGTKIVIDDYLERITDLTNGISNLLPSDAFFNYQDGNRDTTTLDVVVNPLKLDSYDAGVLWINLDIENLSGRDIYITSFMPKFVLAGDEFTVASDVYGEWGRKLFDQTFGKSSSMNNIRIPLSLNNHELPQVGMARLVLTMDYMSTDRVFTDTVQRVIDLDLAELWNSTKMEELDAKLISISKNIDTVNMEERYYLPDVFLGQTKITNPNDIQWQVNSMSYDAENINIDYNSRGLYINAPALKEGYDRDIIALSVFVKSSPYSTPAVFALNVLRSNSIPVALSQSVSLNQNSSKNITLRGIDDDSDTLTYSIVTNPSHGILSGTAPSLRYTPHADYIGRDSFRFKVNDGREDSRVSTVNITINSGTTDPETPTPVPTPVPTDDTDVTPPTITIVGDNPMTIIQGDTYVELGAILDDYESGIDEDKTTYINNVNTNAVGEYRVTYGAIDYAGNSATAIRIVNVVAAPNSGDIVHDGVTYGTVTSPHTRRVWLDRNLGASRVCTAYNDSACYGGYYQWTSIEDWAKVDGSSICPIGYRVPSISEINDEILDQGLENNFDAFNSFLKLPSAGSITNGTYINQGWYGNLYSNSMYGLQPGGLMFYTSIYWFGDDISMSIRCIENY